MTLIISFTLHSPHAIYTKANYIGRESGSLHTDFVFTLSFPLAPTFSCTLSGIIHPRLLLLYSLLCGFLVQRQVSHLFSEGYHHNLTCSSSTSCYIYSFLSLPCKILLSSRLPPHMRLVRRSLNLSSFSLIPLSFTSLKVSSDIWVDSSPSFLWLCPNWFYSSSPASVRDLLLLLTLKLGLFVCPFVSLTLSYSSPPNPLSSPLSFSLLNISPPVSLFLSISP